MQITITCPDNLYEQLLDLRADQHTTINDIAIQALKDYIAKSTQE